MDRRQNILFTIHIFNIGGAQSFLISLLNELTKFHNVYLIDLDPYQRDQGLMSRFNPDVKFIDQPNLLKTLIRKFEVREHDPNATISFKNFYRKVKEELKHVFFNYCLWKYDINIVHSHLLESDVLTSKWLEKSKVHLLTTMHGCYENYYSSNGEFQAEWVMNKKIFLNTVSYILKRMESVIYLSEKNLQVPNLTIYDKAKFTKILNGFKPGHYISKSKKELGISEGDFVFGISSRAIPEKGWESAILSFLAVEEITKNVCLILVGSSDFSKTLQKKYNHPKIHFVGHSYNPLEWVSLFDVGLLPTTLPAESLPNTIIEYLYLGKPVIATAAGSIADMITFENQTCGILINIIDNKPVLQDLTDAMLKLYSDKVFCSLCKEISLKAFKKFSIESCVSKYNEIYQKLS